MNKKRIFAWILTLSMLFSMFGGIGINSYADSSLNDEYLVNNDWVYGSVNHTTIYPVAITEEGETDTIKTTLVDGAIQKGSRKTFDVFARDKDGKKIKSTVTLNDKPVKVTWDDNDKTSYTLVFSKEGENTVIVTAGEATVTYKITYEKAQKGDVIGQAAFSLEGFTVDMGYIIEPIMVDVIEGENNAQLLDRILKQHGFDYECTGNLEQSFYLARLKNIPNIEKAKVTKVVYDILVKNGKEIWDWEGQEDQSLGEFDFTSGSGWMYCINNVFPNVGYADSYLGNKDVIRTQFTTALGSDIGGASAMGGGNGSKFFEDVNRDELTYTIAQIGYENVSNEIKEIAVKINPTQEEIDKCTEELKKSIVTPIEKDALNTIINNAAKYELKVNPNPNYPTFGTNNGEWTMLCLARAGYLDLSYNEGFTEEYIQTYITNFNRIVTETIDSNKNGLLHSAKGTEYSRSILALSSLGIEAKDVAGKYDFIAPYADYNYINRQGINGPIFALIALDTQGYSIPEDNTVKVQNSRGKMIDNILKKEITQKDGTVGGWALSGNVPDPDITAMALQSLAPYYLNEQKFNEAKCVADYNSFKEKVERGIKTLSDIQLATGGYSSWGTQNSESIAQVIVALTAFGINPLSKKVDLPTINETVSFIKSGDEYVGIYSNNVIDALLAFLDEPSGGFCHVKTGSDGGGGSGTGVNGMATDQALYALIAYARYLDGEKTLYNMTDVNLIKSISIITPPAKVQYQDGEKFDKTGMIINVNYQNGTSKEIQDFVVDKDIVSEGDTTVTINYRGKSVVQPITVANEIKPLEITVTKKDNFINGMDAKFEFEVRNSGTDKISEGLLITALYDLDTNQMITYNYVKQDLEIGGICRWGSMLPIPQTGKYKIKSFVWDSMINPETLSNVQEIVME